MPTAGAGETVKRFYVEAVGPEDTQVFLDPDESHHLLNVLRLRVGDLVELFDGSGCLFVGEIVAPGKRAGIALKSRQRPPVADTPPVIVCQGDLKGGKIDFLVEKCTELGVARFIPFTACRSQGRQDPERLQRRRQRRQSIVKKACKQCGRLTLMEVDQDIGFSELLAAGLSPTMHRVMLWEKADALTLKDVIGSDPQPVCLMFGPEGGFADKEAEQALSAGWQPVSLGGLILRAETATIAAVAVTRHLLGCL